MKLPQEIIDGVLNPEGSSIGSLLQLDGYVHTIFTFDLPKSYFILLIASASWIAILILCGLPIFLNRIYKKKFWLIRSVQRKEGLYIVPNAITSFVVCIALFGICWIITCALEVMAYMMKMDLLQNALPAMQILCWWPLLTAISCVAWGSFFSIGSIDTPKVLHPWMPRPIILNILCLGSPFLVGLVQVPLAIYAELTLRKNLKNYHQFHQRILEVVDLIPDPLLLESSASSTVLESLALDPKEGRSLFLMAVSTIERHKKAAYCYRIAFAIWSILSLILLIFYAIVGYQLTARLYRKMRQHYFSLEPCERSEEKPWHSTWKTSLSKIIVPKKVRIVLRRGSKGIIPRVKRRSDTFMLYDYAQESDGNIQTHAEVSRSISPFRSLPDLNDGLNSDQIKNEMCVNSISHVYISAPKTSRSPNQNDAKERLAMYRYTYRCWISLTILYLSILLALCSFTSTSILWSTQIVRSVNNGPISTGNLYQRVHLLCAWSCIIFGTSAAFAIISRAFDPAPRAKIRAESIRQERCIKQTREKKEDQYCSAMQIILSPSSDLEMATTPKTCDTFNETIQPMIESRCVQNEIVSRENVGLSCFNMEADQPNSQRDRRDSLFLSCDNLDHLDRLEEYTNLSIRRKK